jgi:hypothetical protein
MFHQAAEQQYVIQMPHAVVIELSGETATARATMHEMMRGADGGGMQMWRTYYGDLVRTHAGWRYKMRRFRTAVFHRQAPAGDLLRTYPARN